MINEEAVKLIEEMKLYTSVWFAETSDARIKEAFEVLVDRAKALALLRDEPDGKYMRHQPCGCILCVCESEDRCLGCGAKMCDKHKEVGHLPIKEMVEAKPTCSECGGRGKIILPKDELDVSRTWREEPCPKCQPQEPTMHTPCAGESGGMYPRPTGSKPKYLSHFARAEEIKKIWPKWKQDINSLPNTTNAPQEPKPNEFVERFRDLIDLSEDALSNNKIGRLQTLGREAADRIEALERAVEGYQENIDNQYQTIVTQREQIAEQQRRLRTKKEAE